MVQLGEQDCAPCMTVHGPPSIAYWNVTPLLESTLLTTINRSSTAPSRASDWPLGSLRVTDGVAAGFTLEATTAVAVTGALLWPELSSRTIGYVCEPSPASSSVHER